MCIDLPPAPPTPPAPPPVVPAPPPPIPPPPGPVPPPGPAPVPPPPSPVPPPPPPPPVAPPPIGSPLPQLLLDLQNSFMGLGVSFNQVLANGGIDIYGINCPINLVMQNISTTTPGSMNIACYPNSTNIGVSPDSAPHLISVAPNSFSTLSWNIYLVDPALTGTYVISLTNGVETLQFNVVFHEREQP